MMVKHLMAFIWLFNFIGYPQLSDNSEMFVILFMWPSEHTVTWDTS